jgi:DNA-binding Lrp family transcriptional regulator
METLTSQIDKTAVDILKVLSRKTPQCTRQLIEESELVNMSEYAWEFALEKLLKFGYIREFIPPFGTGTIYYQLSTKTK